MDRRHAVATVLGLGAAAAWRARAQVEPKAAPLQPPARGKINVAVLVSDQATVIDFAGPWEVFQDVQVESRGSSTSEVTPFQLFTVAESREPITASAGLRILPNYTLEDCPAPRVIVVGAQRGHTPRVIEWLRTRAATADLTMSVCTGAFLLAKTGLLEGLEATTHHDFFESFARQFPGVKLRRGLRFVESAPKLATAGGLTSGVDLALRVVERYFGRAVAQQTADYMEYQGTGWRLG